MILEQPFVLSGVQKVSTQERLTELSNAVAYPCRHSRSEDRQMATPGQPTSCKPACNELAHNGCRPGAANAVPGDFFGVSRALCRVIAPKREYSVAMASENSIDCLKLCKTRGGNPRQQGGASDSSRISIIPTGAAAAVCAARRGGNWRELSAILLSHPRGALHWRGTSGVAEIAEIRSAVSAGPFSSRLKSL